MCRFFEFLLNKVVILCFVDPILFIYNYIYFARCRFLVFVKMCLLSFSI